MPVCTSKLYFWLVRERRDSNVIALELRLSCINPSIWKRYHALSMPVCTSKWYCGLVRERRNPSAIALALRLSCINPSIWKRCHALSMPVYTSKWYFGLVQERRNSNVIALELRLSGINPSIWKDITHWVCRFAHQSGTLLAIRVLTTVSELTYGPWLILPHK